MLPINNNAPARENIKADQINSNNHQGSKAATDEDYQEILSSLEQAPVDSQEHTEQQAGLTENEINLQQKTQESGSADSQEQMAVIAQPGLLAEKTQQEQKPVQGRATSETTSQQAITQTATADSQRQDLDINSSASSEVSVRQTQEQVLVSQAQVDTENKSPTSTTKPEKQVIATASTEQLNQALTQDTTAADPISTSKQAEQASQASSQAVSILYRQQELHSAGKLSSDQMQLMTEQNTGLANNGLMLNKLDGLHTSVIQNQTVTDIRGLTDSSTGKTQVEGLFSSPGQAQTLAMDTTLAERSQTAAGKYEWSMLKLDSQKQNWSRQLFNTLQDRIEMQANQQIKQAKIRLDPPELGRLELMVRIEGDRMSVSVNASNAAVREALQETNERLRQELENQFGSSVDVNVGSDSSDQPFKNEEEMVAVSNVEATEINHGSVPLTTGWLNALA